MTISPTTREETSERPIACSVALNLADQAIDIGGRDRPFGAGDADAAHQFVAVEFFAGAILLDDQGRG